MSEHVPRRGDKFYDQNRLPKQPNGVIAYVDWEGKEVIVQFYDDGGRETYSFEEIEDHYDPDHFGGYYALYVQVPPVNSNKTM